MCFDKTSSLGFALAGGAASYWIYSRTHNYELARGVFFFFLMEFLQFLQYFVIADDMNSPICDNWLNKFLTLLGFLHICLQPFFCHSISASLTKSEKYLAQYRVIKRLCLMGGGLLFVRYLLAPLAGYSTMNVSGYNSTEWLRGEKLCTFNGKYHLAWSVPMADPTYYIPGAGIHSFLMFAPFLALYEKKGMIVQGVFLFLTGPYLASFITANLMEQASIWCFFSIAQILTMLFFIREALITGWGREKYRKSIFSSHTEDKSSKAKAT